MGKLVLTAETLTTASAGTFECDTKVPYFTPQGLQRGVVPGMQYYSLNSALAGTNATGGQAVLGVGVTLSSSTVYAFEGVYALSKSAGGTSYTLATLFGGTATLNNINYAIVRSYDTASFTTVNNSGSVAYSSVATAITTMSAATSSTAFIIAQLKGRVSVNAGGTFIPQYSLSAAPGGAFTTAIGSYFLIYPISTSGSNTSVGEWA